MIKTILWPTDLSRNSLKSAKTCICMVVPYCSWCRVNNMAKSVRPVSVVFCQEDHGDLKIGCSLW